MRALRLTPVYLALLAVSAVFLFPFYWVIISSLESVEGMSLKPPAFFPAEARTANLTATSAGRIVRADKGLWLRLTSCDDLIGSGKNGAYYVGLDNDAPTQLVAWWADRAVETTTIPKQTVEFKKLPVHHVAGGNVVILAKLVRQAEDHFDELLFTVPEGTTRFDSARVLRNVKHDEIRDLRPHWENFPQTLKGPEATIGGKSNGFLLFMRNSFFISGMAVLGQVFVSSLVAFGFARLQFKGRDAIFVLLLATLMVPAQVTLIPLFTIYKSVGWIDTFLPLIVPHFTAGAFNVFLIRQFLLSFPRELDESAAIDGATPWRVYRSIILPNCTPVLIVVGLFTFVGTWQDVMGPLIYLDNPAYRTVTLGLEYFRSPYIDNRNLLMTGAFLAMIPVGILFLIGQRYIMAGIATTGMK